MHLVGRQSCQYFQLLWRIYSGKTESTLLGFDFHPHMALLSGCHITPLENPFLFLQDSAMFAGTKQFSLRHTNPVRLRVFLQVSFAKVPFPVISHVSSVWHLNIIIIIKITAKVITTLIILEPRHSQYD